MEVKRLIMCCYCLKDIEDKFNNNKNKQSKGREIICVKMSDFYLCYNGNNNSYDNINWNIRS